MCLGDKMFLLLMAMPFIFIGAIVAATNDDDDDATAPDEFTEVGTEGDDTLLLTEGSDVASGLAGNDLLTGLAGFDDLFGDAGNDTLDGGAGQDLLVGGEGDDSLLGGDWLDGLFGDAGNDTLDGGNFDDVLFGGDGSDGLIGGDGNDLLVGGAGEDELLGDEGGDLLVASDGVVNVEITPEDYESIRGAGTASAFDVADLEFTGGTDISEDFISAGSGDDIIVLGNSDTANGAEGSDTFILGDWITQVSVIEDFNPAEDTLIVVQEAGNTEEVTLVDTAMGIGELRIAGELVATINGNGAFESLEDEVTPNFLTYVTAQPV